MRHLQVNPDTYLLIPEIKPELIGALGRLKRRDMENFCCQQPVGRRDGAQVGMIAQIRMAVSECV